ncbi:polysaccharide deacetylase family protein [Paenibacillus sp. MAHUQ-46]|uniref:Polysaccharide deacetylase family protein n=2 Tax=Paenibacillus TaxID=44249 RepID=A0A934MS08_9BACL|nr:polysaccharide deacetylase family protein [Paenibacillus roseus]
MAATLLLFGFAAAFQGGIADYIQQLKNGNRIETAYADAPAEAGKAKGELDSLYEQISREAIKRRVAPVNATVDRVWKAIPGYNGLEVDVEETYRLAKASPEAPIRYQYYEVEPKVKLENLGEHPIYKGNPNKPMVSFMINVAWGNEFLEPILKTLKEEKVKATFFLDGSWLKKNVELARRIQLEEHELSNHAYSHPDMSRLGREAAYQQISKTEALLKSELNVANKWFAPPSGDFNQMTVKVAAEQGLKTVLWTLDTVDWKKPPASSIVQKIRLRIEPGGLILMHPTASSSEALPGMIREIRKKGLTIGTVSETLSEKRVPEVE